MILDQTTALIKAIYQDQLTDACDVYRNTPGAADGFGVAADAWAITTTEPCLVKQPSATEDRDGQEAVFRRKVVLMRAAADVADDDRIRYPAATGDYYHIVAVETLTHGTVTHRKRVTIERES